MSDRRVFSRLVISSFLISTSPPGFRRTSVVAFSLATTPVSVSPLAALGRDGPLPEARIHFAVRIDDVRQKLGFAVGAHPGQRRTDVDLPEIAELVTRRARAGEDSRRALSSRGTR
jgi:hypothetical protein